MRRICLFVLIILFSLTTLSQAQIPKTLSYQGVLANDSGEPLTGDQTLTFKLYDAASGGNELWQETQTMPVTDGIFSVILGSVTPLDLPFDRPYWLGVTVGSGTELEPRIQLTGSAYSMNALTVADSSITAAKLAAGAAVKSIRIGSTTLQDEVTIEAGDNVSLALDGNRLMISADAGVTADTDWNVSGDDMYAAVSGRVGIGTDQPTEKLDVSGNLHVSGDLSAQALNLDGSGGINRISAQDTLEVYIGGERVLRIEPAEGELGFVPNIIAGFRGNSVADGVAGATIAGGGSDSFINRIESGAFGTIGGGVQNTVGGEGSTISGGDRNEADGDNATVGGGSDNEAKGDYTTVGGGSGNEAKGDYTTVGGGHGNEVTGRGATVGGGSYNVASGRNATVSGGNSNTASGFAATVPGGQSNSATGDYSFAAGTAAQANHDGAFVWQGGVNLGPFSSTGVSQFLIRAPSGVGIGTNTPGAQLDVNGDMRITKKGAGVTLLTLNTDRSWAFRQLGSGSATALELVSIGGGGNKYFIINTTGRVGIGTTSPAFTLHVNGSAGKPGGGSWSNASDKRLKDVQGRFNRGLEAVSGLNPIVYKYKKDNPLHLPSEREYVGLIAQEVQKVIPEAVETDKGEYLHLNNDPIIWTMLNAIKQLHQENVALKTEMRELRAMQAKVARLETTLLKLERLTHNELNTEVIGAVKISMK